MTNIKLATLGTVWIGLDSWWQEISVTCYQLETDESRRFSASGLPFAESPDEDMITVRGASPQEAIQKLLGEISRKREAKPGEEGKL